MYPSKRLQLPKTYTVDSQKLTFYQNNFSIYFTVICENLFVIQSGTKSKAYCTSLYEFNVKLTLLPFPTHNKNVRLFYRKDIKALCIVLPATTLWSVSHRCKLFGFMHYMFYSLKIFLNVFSKFGCLAGQISY